MPRYRVDLGELDPAKQGQSVIVQSQTPLEDRDEVLALAAKQAGITTPHPETQPAQPLGFFARAHQAAQPGAEYVAEIIKTLSPVGLATSPDVRARLAKILSGEVTPGTFRDREPTGLGQVLNIVPGSPTAAAVLAVTGGAGSLATRAGLTGAKALAARVGLPSLTQFSGSQLEGQDPITSLLQAAFVGLASGASEAGQLFKQKGLPFLKSVKFPAGLRQVDKVDTKDFIAAIQADVPALAPVLNPNDPATLVKALSPKVKGDALSSFYKDKVLNQAKTELGTQDLSRSLGVIKQERVLLGKAKPKDPLTVDEAVDTLLGLKAQRRQALRAKEQALPENRAIIERADKAEKQFLGVLSEEGQTKYALAAKNYRDGHDIIDFITSNTLLHDAPGIGPHVQFRVGVNRSLGQALLDKADELPYDRFPEVWKTVTRKTPELAMDVLQTVFRGERVSTRVAGTGQFLASSVPPISRLLTAGKYPPSAMVSDPLLNLLSVHGAQTGLSRMGLVPQGNQP